MIVHEIEEHFVTTFKNKLAECLKLNTLTEVHISFQFNRTTRIYKKNQKQQSNKVFYITCILEIALNSTCTSPL